MAEVWGCGQKLLGTSRVLLHPREWYLHQVFVKGQLR